MTWTVQKLIDAGMTVTAYCREEACNHSANVDLERLMARLGPDAEAMADNLVPRLKCDACGGKRVGLIYSPQTDYTYYRNKYAEAKGR